MLRGQQQGGWSCSTRNEDNRRDWLGWEQNRQPEIIVEIVILKSPGQKVHRGRQANVEVRRNHLGVAVQESSAWIRFERMGDGEGKETPQRTKEVRWAQSPGHCLYLGMLCTTDWMCVNPRIHLWKLGVKVLGHRALRSGQDTIVEPLSVASST